MFNLQPGQGLGSTGSQQIALGLAGLLIDVGVSGSINREILLTSNNRVSAYNAINDYLTVSANLKSINLIDTGESAGLTNINKSISSTDKKTGLLMKSKKRRMLFRKVT